jgi:hypothetical protein
MNGTEVKQFHYHANAHVLSGQFHRPIQHLIEVQGATTLSTSGGVSSSHVEKFRFNDYVFFEKGYSHVSGSVKKLENKAIHTTLVTSVVEGLNILDVVTADRIVARLSSSYDASESEPRILLTGSKFENLRVAGCKVDVEFNHDLFHKLDTFDAVRKDFASNAEFRRIAEDPYQSGNKQKQPEPHGVLLCSLVKEVKTDCPGVQRRGHCLVVPDFGRIYLAELLCEYGEKTLTMLRLELGSPCDGGVSVVGGRTNGRPWPG